jgi:hypothetical protein
MIELDPSIEHNVLDLNFLLESKVTLLFPHFLPYPPISKEQVFCWG